MWRQRSISSIKYRNTKPLTHGFSTTKIHDIYIAYYSIINSLLNRLKEMLGFQIKNKKVLLLVFAICLAAISIGVLIITNR